MDWMMAGTSAMLLLCFVVLFTLINIAQIAVGQKAKQKAKNCLNAKQRLDVSQHGTANKQTNIVWHTNWAGNHVS